MTPLAHAVMKEVLRRPSDRTIVDDAGILELMDDIHCFEVSEILEVAQEMAVATVKKQMSNVNGAFEQYRNDGVNRELPIYHKIQTQEWFLPTPRTWIEYRVPENAEEGIDKNARLGILLVQHKFMDCDEYFAEVYSAARPGDNSWFRSKYHGVICFGGINEVGKLDLFDNPWRNAIEEARLYAFLSIINAPHIIGRRTMRPHKGLAKAARQQARTYALRDWTEIKLEVMSDGSPEADGGPTERLTGKKALHYCRAHLRIVGGNLVRVRGHWRGDAAFGHVQSRYKVVNGGANAADGRLPAGQSSAATKNGEAA